VYGALVSRFPRRVFVPVVYAFFALGMFAFLPWLDAPTAWTARAFYIWVSVFNLFVVSVFWSFLADIFTEDQARRLYGWIGVGGTSGSILGPLFAKQFVDHIGIAGLLVASSGLLVIALLITLQLGSWARRHAHQDRRNQDRVGGGFWAGARIVWQNPFMRRMALLLLFSDMVGTALYSLNSDLGRTLFDTPEARTKFFATLDVATNVLILCLQGFISWFVLSRFRQSHILIVCALLNAALLTGLMVFSTPLSLMITLVVSRAIGYGLVQAARESLYTRVDREARYKAKGFTDTAVWRGGDVIASKIVAMVQAAGGTLSHMGAICITACLASAWMSRGIEKLPGQKDHAHN
jgi:ATP:ADP antiporter, AAA family